MEVLGEVLIYHYGLIYEYTLHKVKSQHVYSTH